jgi:hypothetical protein
MDPMNINIWNDEIKIIILNNAPSPSPDRSGINLSTLSAKKYKMKAMATSP